MREVDRRLAPGHGHLLEDTPRAPGHAARASRETAAAASAPGPHETAPDGAAHSSANTSLASSTPFVIALQQGLDLRRPDRRKGIGPGPPIARLLRRRRHRPVSHSRAVRILMPADAAAAAWVLPSIRFCLKSRTCASLTMSLQALSVTQTSRLTRSGRSNCRQAADLIVAAQHSTRERLQHRGRASERECFERFATGEHQHHQSARQVLLKQHGCDDRDSSEQVGAELATNELEREGQHERHAARDEHGVEWERLRCWG